MKKTPEYIRGWDNAVATILHDLSSEDKPEKNYFYKRIFKRFYGTKGEVKHSLSEENFNSIVTNISNELSLNNKQKEKLENILGYSLNRSSVYVKEFDIENNLEKLFD